MRARLLWTSLFVAAFVSDLAPGQQLNWDGTCGNAFWHSQCGSNTNWNPEVLPSLIDMVAIPQGAPVVSIPGAIADCSSISCQSGLSLTSNALLRIAGTGGSIQNLAHTLGTIDLQTPGATLTLLGNSTIGSGKFGGSGEFVNAGSIAGGSLELLGSCKLSNDQQMTLFRIFTTANNIVANEFGATMTFTPGTTNPGISGNGVFENSGTWIVQHSGPTSTFSFETIVNTGGPLIVQGVSSPTGTRLLRGGTIGGLITVNDDAHLHFASTGTAPYVYDFDGGSITGNGNVYFEAPTGPAGSDLQINDQVDVNLTGSLGLVLPGATYLTLNDGLINHGKALWSGTTIRTGACKDCTLARFDNRGSQFILNTGSSSNAVSLAGSFINSPGATFNHVQGNLILTSDGSLQNWGLYHLYRGDIRRQTAQISGSFSVPQNGIVSKPAGPDTGLSRISADFHLHNQGQVIVDASTLTFSNGSLNMRTSSNIAIGQGATVRFIDGVHRVMFNGGEDALIDGLGTCVLESEIAAGDLRVDEQATLEFDLGNLQEGGLRLGITGRMGGSGVIEMSRENQFYWEGGVIGVATLDGGQGPVDASVFSKGVTQISAGSIVGPASLFTNENGGVVNHNLGIITLNGAGATLANQGLWRYPLGSTGLRGVQGFGSNTAFINDTNGVFEVEAGAVSTHTVRFTNRGTVRVKGLGSLSVPNVVGLSGGVLTEGTWIVEPGGVLDLGAANVTAIGADTTLTGSGSGCPDVHPFTNDGTLTANGDWECPGSLTNNGELNCESGVFEVFNDLILSGGSCHVQPDSSLLVGSNCHNNGLESILESVGGTCDVGGNLNNGTSNPGQSALSFCDHANVVPFAGGGVVGGFICTNFNNNARGMIRPGGPEAPGPFKLNGNLNLVPAGGGGAVQIELGGAVPVDQHDQVMVEGDVALGGYLHVRMLPPFAPFAGQQFTILTATGTMSGQFDEIVGHGQYAFAYGSNSVTLTVLAPPEPGDINGDLNVNIDDLLAVISAWGACPVPPAGCPADVAPWPDGDGQVNINDLLLVISSWG